MLKNREKLFSAYFKMKLNENTVIQGNSVLLVPYEEYHVIKYALLLFFLLYRLIIVIHNPYHNWMKSEELQVLTSSEPLSLEEEYNMQKTWRTDPDKCTFIILDKVCYDEHKDEVRSMIGDTNIFLKSEIDPLVGEIEIMIAENSARGRGFGKEAVLLMLRYGVEHLNIAVYEAKIGVGNDKSISLFTKIGFEKVCENKIFNEITFERKVTKSWVKWLLDETKCYSKKER